MIIEGFILRSNDTPKGGAAKDGGSLADLVAKKLGK